MALKWDQSERSQNFRYKVTAVFVRGLFSKFFPRCGERWQMRCRLILLITEHPIQQGIRKGGVRHFCDEDGRTRTDEDRMAYSRKWDVVLFMMISDHWIVMITVWWLCRWWWCWAIDFDFDNDDGDVDEQLNLRKMAKATWGRRPLRDGFVRAFCSFWLC